MIRQLFSIESDFAEAGYPNGLPGWTRGERWNGWACPRFEKKEALALSAYLHVAGFEEQRSGYDEATDTFFLQRGDNEEEREEWKGEPLDTPEGTVTVYAIGAWCWIWDAIPTPDTIAEKFLALLREHLGATPFALVCERNLTEENAGVCHSHDFCDANMVMVEAFEALGLRAEDDSITAMCDTYTNLWNEAWNRATDQMKVLALAVPR